MKITHYISGYLLLLVLASCETSDEFSHSLDHEVPACTALTITASGKTMVIDDSISWKMLWGVVPQSNLETIELPTVTTHPGAIIDISVVISDNVAVKTAELNYGNWLFSKYINFTNPEGDIPLTPQHYTFTARLTVPDNAISSPWIETFYYNDGSSIKYLQAYHQLSFTVVDVNMNTRTIPIFVKVE